MPSTKPSTPSTSVCTCMRLRKASRLVTQIYDRMLEPSGLTVTQYGLLANLGKHDGIGIGALAEILIMDPTTLTRSLRPLERQGFIVIAPDPNDKRSRRVRLTETGRSAFLQAKPAWQRAQHYVEQALGAKDARSIHAALDLVLERLAS